jgi:hypothetical protein
MMRAAGKTLPRSTERVGWPPDALRRVAMMGKRKAAVFPEPENKTGKRHTRLNKRGVPELRGQGEIDLHSRCAVVAWSSRCGKLVTIEVREARHEGSLQPHTQAARSATIRERHKRWTLHQLRRAAAVDRGWEGLILSCRLHGSQRPLRLARLPPAMTKRDHQ